MVALGDRYLHISQPQTVSIQFDDFPITGSISIPIVDIKLSMMENRFDLTGTPMLSLWLAPESAMAVRFRLPIPPPTA